MLLKNLSLLSLAVVVAADASVTNLNLRENGRSLQDSVVCIAFGQPFEECCPSADPDDGICTLIWCVDLDNVTIRDDCSCDQLEIACAQVDIFSAEVDGLADMCASVDNCCGVDGTDNGEFNTCLGAAIIDGNLTVPDFDILIPGGVPDLFNATDAAVEITDVLANITDPLLGGLPDLFGEVDNATDVAAEITDALAEITDTLADTLDAVPDIFGGGDNATEVLAEITDAEPVTTTATTVAPGDSTDAIEEPDDTNGAPSRNHYAVKTLISLIGSSLSMILV